MPGSKLSCVACDMEITTTPVRYSGLPYCCEGCAAGGPCTCSYDAYDTDRVLGADSVDHLGIAFRPLPAAPAVLPAVHATAEGSIADITERLIGIDTVAAR